MGLFIFLILLDSFIYVRLIPIQIKLKNMICSMSLKFNPFKALSLSPSYNDSIKSINTPTL